MNLDRFMSQQCVYMSYFYQHQFILHLCSLSIGVIYSNRTEAMCHFNMTQGRSEASNNKNMSF